MEDIIERISLYKKGTNIAIVEDVVRIVMDRISLRLYPYESKNFPTELKSIAVEISLAMINRAELNHEGVDNEKVDAFSIQFAEDLLKPYLEDIECFKRTVIKNPRHDQGVQFL